MKYGIDDLLTEVSEMLSPKLSSHNQLTTANKNFLDDMIINGPKLW